MRVVSTLLFVLALCANTFAQQSKSLQDLRSEAAISLKFDVIPTATEIKRLESMGLKLASYLGDNTYEVVVAKGADLEKAKKAFTAVESPMRKSYNGIAEDITAKRIPQHATHNNGTLDIAITFKQELNAETVAVFLKENNATLVRNIAKGQVVVLNVAKDKVQSIIDEPFVLNVEFEEEEVASLNFENKSIHGAHYVHKNSVPGMELDGAGVVIGVGDGGRLGEHIDFGPNVIKETPDYAENFGQHGDHVAGTIASLGNLDPKQSGFAAEASLIIEKTSNIIYGAEEYYDNYGMLLTNNSYGSSFNCDDNGSYNYTSFTLDKQLRDMPHLMHVFAAGNNGAATCDGFPQGFNTVLKYYGSAKNVLTVGSVDEGLELAGSSSKGPVKDGRIKPEICGVGVNVTSNGRENNYIAMSGTSMAAPSVTGSMALMYQKYEQDNGEIARGDLMKAIICNSADDMGVEGPDYRFGFGLVNTYRAVKTIEDGHYILGEVENSQKSNHILSVPAGVKEAKFLLYWNDKEVTAGPDRTLVNNLDIEIISPNGEVILPWVLNHNSSNVDEPAKQGVDNLNNIEQITIQNPLAGEYTLVVKGTEVPFGPQAFAVAYEMNKEEILLTFPAGSESLIPNDKYAIAWMANRGNTNSFKLEFSMDGGNTWDLIVDQIPADHRTYEWRTPNIITQNAKIRLSMNTTDLEHSNEQVFNILGKPTALTAIPVCKETIRLVWEENNTADQYVVYMLKSGRMEVIGETDQKHMDVEYLFEEGQVYWFSVANKMNLGNEGERVIAISATAKFELECDRDNDGKLIDIRDMQNGREFTNLSLGEASSFGVLIQNNGNNELSNYDVSVQINSEKTFNEKYTGTLQSGEEGEYEFDNTFDFSAVGTYAIDTWMSHPLDNLHYNDSIVGQVEIKQLPNEPVSLPLQFDFEETVDFYHPQTSIGLGDLTHFDFMKGEVVAESYTESMGNMNYIVLENHEHATDEANAYIMTVNMTDYEMAKDVVLSFDSKVFSEDLAKGAEVWLRGSDRDEWIKLMDIENDREWVSIENVEINAALLANYQVMSTSTQVKFALHSKGSISLDNIQLDLLHKEEVVEEAEYSIVDVYPNIVLNDISLEIENENATDAEIAIVNSNGQIVHEMMENLDLGKNIFNYNATQDLNPGMYFITIKMGSYTEVKKFSKISE